MSLNPFMKANVIKPPNNIAIAKTIFSCIRNTKASIMHDIICIALIILSNIVLSLLS